MSELKYKYVREAFGPMPVALKHLTMYVNFLDTMVEASNLLDMVAARELSEIELDAKELKILRVEWVEGTGAGESAVELDYLYRQNEDKLVVKLPRIVAKGEAFRVRTLTRCVPSENVLEGIYQDVTPEGAPQQYMSQCQQWGFQRIMPIFDDCRAKCTMTTTIEADARYTHLISNGNIHRGANPEGKPVPKPGDPSRQTIRYENDIPMAPYLFLVAVGTWDTLVGDVTYPSGKKVRLEYLVPPGRVDGVRIPMEILKDSVRWVGRTQDYEYRGDTYRTICMGKSNFGGMENMGNTTIVTDAALIDEHTLDQTLLYAHAVIVHEFEHNQCGSETTMDTPFDVWLNEAYTVDVERQYMADTFNADFVRLSQVDSIRNPLLGPLAIEDGGTAGKIVREGFNDPDELIDGVTYVKAAEVIRMLRLIVGAKKFREGKSLYFSRYRYGNADTDQFFACFEEVSGRSLEQFKKRWLYTIGYPKVTATTTYDAASKEYSIEFTQELAADQTPFHLPLELALVDGAGKVVPGTDRVFELTQGAARLTFPHIDQAPAFASLNRGYSFYGTFTQTDLDGATLAVQALCDPNAFNRVEAMRQLTDRQRTGLLENGERPIDADWLDLFGRLLRDESLPSGLKAYLLRIDEQPLDRRYCTWYQELVSVRETLMRAVNRHYREELLARFRSLETSRPRETPKAGLEDRLLKNVLLELIVIDDSPESHRLIVDYHDAASKPADRVAPLAALNRSSAPERLSLLNRAYDEWHGHLSGYANYLRIVSAGTRDDVFDMIALEKKRPTFDIRQPTWSRALFLPMAVNNKMVWTDRGIQWVADTVVELAGVNQYTASRLLNAFQHVRNLRPRLKPKVEAALQAILQQVKETVSPTVVGQAKAYLHTAGQGADG